MRHGGGGESGITSKIEIQLENDLEEEKTENERNGAKMSCH